jgi:hypothetical protein
MPVIGLLVVAGSYVSYALQTDDVNGHLGRLARRRRVSSAKCTTRRMQRRGDRDHRDDEYKRGQNLAHPDLQREILQRTTTVPTIPG